MNNLMKRILCGMIAVMMLVCFAACGEKETEEKDEKKSKVEAEEVIENEEAEIIQGESETIEEEPEVVVDEDAEKVAEWVEENKDVFVSAFEEEAGDLAEADIRADGTDVVLEFKSDLFGMMETADYEDFASEMESALNMEDVWAEEPAITGIIVELYDGDGTLLFEKELN